MWLSIIRCKPTNNIDISSISSFNIFEHLTKYYKLTAAV